MKTLEIPTSAKEAVAQGRTYFMASRKCPIHHTRAHWAGNGACMACRDINGEPYMIRPMYENISKPRKPLYEDASPTPLFQENHASPVFSLLQ